MYDSLAAELKAKLADSKQTPILLPPRDYDTLTRRQGKLTGSELRRSTNPQLVGVPHNSHISSTRQEVTRILTEEPEPESSLAINQSARGGSLRSRSNSSSGLGSISLNDQSRSPSSQSSENEDSSPSGKTTTHDDRLKHDGTMRDNDDDGKKAQQENSLDSSAGSRKESLKVPALMRVDQNGTKKSNGTVKLWNGRNEIPLKINIDRNRDQTYLATKQIIY